MTTRSPYLFAEKHICRSNSSHENQTRNTDWFKIGKEVWQGCVLSPCLLKFDAEYLMWNAGLDESQAGTQIADRSINNLTYADDTTLMAENVKELKSLLMRVKEERKKAGLKQHSKNLYHGIWSHQSAQSCLTLCDPMNHSTPGLPVHHQLPEFTQTHVHWVGDAIQPSHPLSSPSPPALNLSQHQGLFKWVSSSQQVVKLLDFQLSISPFNEYSGLISFRMNWLDLLAVQGTIWSHYFMANRRAKSGSSDRLSFLVFQNHSVVAAAMKIKDACYLEGKL